MTVCLHLSWALVLVVFALFPFSRFNYSAQAQDERENVRQLVGRECHEYGCSLYPPELMDEKVIRALTVLRQRWTSEHGVGGETMEEEEKAEQEEDRHSRDENLSEFEALASPQNSTSPSDEGYDAELSPILHVLSESESSSGTSAALTLIGYKGGALEDQINQDRAVIVSPFFVQNNKAANGETVGKECVKIESLMAKDFIVGVFDGHGRFGEVVAQYATVHLPRVLSEKLAVSSGAVDADDEPNGIGDTSVERRKTRQSQVVEALQSTFLEIDGSLPHDPSLIGGCSASVAYREGGKIYVANSGDSRTFVASYDRSSKSSHIHYVTREDKPTLPDERARVESMGGAVKYTGKTPRVVGLHPLKNAQYGLAMSRSLGDRAMKRYGVIPDPIVKVLDIKRDIIDILTVKKNVGSGQALGKGATVENVEVSATVDAAMSSQFNNVARGEDDLNLFIVSATDGMLHYFEPSAIADFVGGSLFPSGLTVERGGKMHSGSPHILSACEDLVTASAQEWAKNHRNMYRDDIAIAVKTVVL